MGDFGLPIHVYFIFNVSDRIFTRVAKYLKGFDARYKFSGLAYFNREPVISAKDLFQNISIISNIPIISGAIDYQFLCDIETTYNIKISDLIYMDRHIIQLPRKKRLFVAQEIIRMLVTDLTKNKVDVVVAHAISDLASYFVWAFCKKQGIRFLYPIIARLGRKMFFSDDPNSAPIGFQKKLSDNRMLFQSGHLDLSDIQLFIEEYIKKRETLKVGIAPSTCYHLFSWEDVRAVCNLFMEQLKNRKGLFNNKNFFALPYQRFRRVLRAKIYRRVISQYLFRDFDKESYIVFPLQLHPEAATLVGGRVFNDQLKLIELVSKNLPVDIVLVVKEHPVSVGRRGSAFFRYLSSLHNVYFVPHDYDVYKLLERSMGIVTLTSSMAIEAMLLKKPVVVFGDIFYQASRNAYKVSDFSLLSEILTKLKYHAFNMEDFALLVKSLLHNTFDFDFAVHDEKDVRSLSIKLNEIIKGELQ